ncbi:MAG TPA: alkaline phosphatase family protein, partial [Vicinamibacterales bacterium]|nr:alkaline phosphatase family protein [Vicinamibacterales bacterium]
PAGAAPAGDVLERPAGAPARWDRLYGRVARELAARAGTDLRLLAVRYTGLDAVGHAYLRYALPREFGDVSEAELEQHGQVLDRYYALVDAEIGELLRLLGPDDLLLVVSGYGMRPLTPPKRLLARLLREPPVSGTHEGAPDGFLLAFGAHVAPGKRSRGAIVDVAPTILYYLGLPVGRDMDGYARADLFDGRFTAARPIAFIGSYEP